MDTIFAVSSGAGRSAIAVIRLSGPACSQVSLKLCGRRLRARQAHVVRLRSPKDGRILDQALALAFEGPSSFTGEDCLEFHVHGGRAVVNSVLEALGDMPNLRAAEPGEFTRRAFENGKLDLDSAEGLADLIEADTLYQHRQAMTSLEGGLAEQIATWRSSIVAIQGMIEAWLDFPDESDISDELVGECKQSIRALLSSIDAALRAAEKAEIARDGVCVLIAGPPNAGKSSLLNRLAQRDVAIVTDVPGTTRDIIEVKLDVGGLPLRLQDGAGIRNTTDIVESLGIERVKAAASKAHVVVWLSPIDEPGTEPPLWLTNSDRDVLLVRSKIDKVGGSVSELGVSVQTDEGIERLISKLGVLAGDLLGSDDMSVPLRHRHLAAAKSLVVALTSALSHMEVDRVELAAEDCRCAASALASLIKPVHSEDVLSEVFSRFCIGK